MSLKIMMTGDRGFIGQETKLLLEADGHEVIGYDIMDGYDIRDLDQLEEFVGEEMPDRILHLAAIARFADADANIDLTHDTNVIGTQNVAEVAGMYHIPVVYASTGSVYMPIKDEPPITEDFPVCGNSVYGCTKAMGEEKIKKYAHPWIILRYAHLYGREKRYHGLIGGFLERIKRGLAPELYGGKQSNDFTYVRDVARANTMALQAPWDKWSQAYNIGTGEELTAEAAGRVICDFAGYEGEVEVKRGREVDPARFVFDVSKAEIMLGFRASFSFREGLKDMFDDEDLQPRVE